LVVVEKTEKKMNKTLQILLVVSGVGLVVWLVSRSRSQTVVVPQPVTATTGTMSLLDQFYGAFGRVPTQSLGGNGNRTANTIKAVGGIVQQLPSVFKGIGDAWTSWRTPSSPKTVTSPSASDSSYEDFYSSTSGWN
jgi:hypothetical protein